MAKKKFSMRPEQGEEGILSNADVEIVEACITTWSDAGENALQGGREADDPCGKITFQPEGGDPQAQYFSAGRAARLCPSEDGETPSDEGPFLIPAEGASVKGLNKQTRLWQFLNSLTKPAEGKLKFNSGLIDDSGMDALVGMKLHVMRVPAPQMSSVAKEEGAREQTMLVCHEIYELPGKGKAAKVVKPTRVAKAEEDEEDEKPVKKGKKVEEEEAEDDSSDPVTEEAQTIVVKALKKAGDDGIEKKALVKAIFGAAAKSENRKKIIALVQQDAFLTEGPWSYDDEDEKLTSLE